MRKAKQESQKNQHIIAIDRSGSTNGIVEYWEKVENLVKTEEICSYIFWADGTPQQLHDKGKALDKINSQQV